MPVSDAALIAAMFRDVPTEIQKKARPALRKIGQQVAQDARGRASWSSRIPRSIGVRVQFTGRRAGVQIVARAKVAPHARPYEGITGRRDHFRHPVFGNTDKWVSQPIRPFLAPAVTAAGGKFTDAMASAIDDAARGVGFK